MKKYCHADLFVANAPHENRAKGVSFELIRVELAADYPKQSDRALHRCLYDRKSVKNNCANNCLAFTYKNRDRQRRAGAIREEVFTSEEVRFLGQRPKPCPRKQRITPSKATELCTAASRRDRQRRAGVICEDVFTVNISNSKLSGFGL